MKCQMSWEKADLLVGTNQMISTVNEQAQIMPYTGERACPWNPATGRTVMTHHIMRYAWATPFCWQKSVVDLGCGTGYGAFLLSWVARHVQGIDIDKRTIEYAHQWFAGEQAHFTVQDMTRGVPDGDIYVAFECLEHVQDIRVVLEAIGSRPLVWSIPVSNNSKYHVRPYSVRDIQTIMRGSDFYSQGKDGQIIAADVAWFDPVYIVGIRR